MIRTFVDSDIAAIYRIQLKCPQAAQWRQKDYLDLAGDPAGLILIAEVEPAELIAGFAAFHRVLDEAELRNMAVDPAHQRKGVAHALFEAGLRRLAQWEVRRIFLEVRASNQPALAFYGLMGFRPLQTRRDYYHDPIEDAVVMTHDIS